MWTTGVNLGTGERVYRVKGQSGSAFGGVGKHTLRLKMVLANGQVLEDEFYYENVQ